MITGHITSWQIDGEMMETVTDFIFLGFQNQNHCRWWLQPWSWKTLDPWTKSCDKHRQHIKKQRQYFASKGPSSQSYGFSSSHVWMWEWDYTGSWALKNLYFWTLVFEKTLVNPLDYKKINPDKLKKSVLNIHCKDWCWSWSSNTLATWCKEPTHWNRPWWWKRSKAGEGENRDWGVWVASPTLWAWIWASLGIGDGQRSLVCCSPRDGKESETTEQLNWTETAM